MTTDEDRCAATGCHERAVEEVRHESPMKVARADMPLHLCASDAARYHRAGSLYVFRQDRPGPTPVFGVLFFE